ncbi:hypothetical protein BDQ94DRAFT_163535 [Aspergillus welwitschiae]|uniref:C2H2 type master regulator of conidiophore development brlA n=1 Tax=Aspergillus welwitschiae TaxID=1341132 RepID=A0A3F3PKU4_9EURO|nr:hypothetical protein BDQ94DRAFT_163535 [Aspergillus welwitschiae]RDH27555.1 hypothetical protein BDQ94DRAFT_163535 [Aspergillus welwitschiae]
MKIGGERGFHCTWDDCDKHVFTRKTDLCRHSRIHTNERPYQCTVKGCSKSCLQRSTLSVHLRTHTGQIPHVREYGGCHKAFSDARRGRPFICQNSTCKNIFRRKETLTKHQHRLHPRNVVIPLPSKQVISDELFPEQAGDANEHLYITPVPVQDPAQLCDQQYYVQPVQQWQRYDPVCQRYTPPGPFLARGLIR